MTYDFSVSLGVILTAALIAAAGMAVMVALALRLAPRRESIFSAQTPEMVFLFDGERLLDATPAARAFLLAQEAGGSAWFRAMAQLEPIFPGLSGKLGDLPKMGFFLLSSRADAAQPLVLRAEWLGGLTRLSVVGPEGAETGSDPVADIAAGEELASLRLTLLEAPLPIWRETARGGVTWANAAYLRVVAGTLKAGRELSWPLPTVFGPLPPEGEPQRRSVLIEGATKWFEVISVATLGEDHLLYALPADRLVKTEQNLREFMNNLTNTFAQLPIGLAIFDSSRTLQVFNPALTDLVGVPVDFLASRPSLSMLLDAMRERQMLPEPKDYRSWRQQLVEMAAAASSGLFQDIWMMPAGQTYRVTGRPHPDGGLAFMIEDISVEVSRARRFRASRELGQAVIDALQEAIIVFSQDGSVTMSNAAAVDLWGKEGLSARSGPRGEPPAITHWRSLTAPSLFWDDLVTAIGSFGPREVWDAELRLNDGRHLACRVAPMPRGATMVRFRIDAAPARPERDAGGLMAAGGQG